ncbi:hypothetical protein, partial [Halobacillus trueperi]|uniref:hypothetical protein n=1 Tax=Halobacillus trueperi TaxID=156205 RepID=UPI0015F24961
DFQNAQRTLEIELKIEKDAGLQKRLDRVEGAIQRTEDELKEANKRAQELSTSINQLKGDERQQTINELAEKDAEVYAGFSKASTLRRELQRFNSRIESKAGNINALNPRGLSRHAGVKQLERGNPEHTQLLSAFEEAKERKQEEIEKEVAEIVQKIEDLIE